MCDGLQRKHADNALPEPVHAVLVLPAANSALSVDCACCPPLMCCMQQGIASPKRRSSGGACLRSRMMRRKSLVAALPLSSALADRNTFSLNTKS